ncbi:hypothetical protein R6Q59_032818 [Mikania micrantha]
MALVSQKSTLNPDAPLFIPAAVRQVEDFSSEWWKLMTTSAWFHDYWLSQQQGEDSFFGDTTDSRYVADMLPDSIDPIEDLLIMEQEYEHFLFTSCFRTVNAFAPSAYRQTPSNGLEAEAKRNIS